MSRTIYPRLFDGDIYEGLKVEDYPDDANGWNNHRSAFARLAKDARLVVEIGTWKGASALTLAECCPAAEIVCIDTWQGSAEMWQNHADSERYGALRLKHGYPTLYWQFLANVIRAGKQGQITPMPMASCVGLELLAKWGAKPDLVYIDGSHEMSAVARDIRDAKKLSPKIICGDDANWDGVKDAATLCFGSRLRIEGVFWFVEL